MKCNVTTGQVFGKLTVIKEGVKFTQPSGQTQRGIVCKCECGNEKTIRLTHLTTGRVVSCGCIMPHRRRNYHKRLYNSWRGMINRCHGKNTIQPQYYKDKGISVCDEWRNSYNAFAEWALSNGWNEKSTIDRKESSKGYYPQNCRMISQYENNLNKESTLIVEYEGVCSPLIELLKEKNMQHKYHTVYNRLKRGISPKEAIDRPIRLGNYKNNFKNEGR